MYSANSGKEEIPFEEKEEGEVVVSVRNVSKKFCKKLKRSMAYGIIDLSKNLLGIKPAYNELRREEFWALDNINFELKRGEALGLTGVNGSGKTTLLRLLAGIFPPDKGEITIKGRVGALIAVGAGFHPHMTGRENIYLNGAILGISSKEIAESLDDIIAFAEIGDFIDAPVSTYSSGMRVRLGFSVATAFKPDVLLVDEILAVGDALFRRRCFDRMRSIMKYSAVIFVSHQMRYVEQFCTRAIYMEQGKIIASGSVNEITERYMVEINRRSALFANRSGPPREGTHELYFTDNVRVYGARFGPNKLSHIGEDLIVEAEFKCNKPMKNVRFRVGIEDLSSGALITAANCSVGMASAGGKIRCKFINLTLRPHAYSILLNISDLKESMDLWPHAMELVVVGGADKKVQYSALDRDLIYIPHEFSVHIGGKEYQHSHDSSLKLSG